MTKQFIDIDYSLLETTRPPIYTAMKYWGKKPHNIWSKYIETYTAENGIYLDPFAGSAVGIFEAIRLNRKAICFDLNPLTSFLVEVISSEFDSQKFSIITNQILAEIKLDKIYKKYYITPSRNNNGHDEVHCFKWNDGKLYEVGIIQELNNKQRKYKAEPIKHDFDLAEEMKNIVIDKWYPTKNFYNSPSFNANFIKNIGGKDFSALWTKRNLYVLAEIYYKILQQTDNVIKQQLLFGFIQTVHLCSKMCVPRNEGANRDFSTSWGRSAYICAKRQMEMNPLYVFQSSCLGKQSVTSCLENAREYLGKHPNVIFVNDANKCKNKLSGFDIKYGIVDINNIRSYIPDQSIDFILTDPPYGGLVQYLDLSTIWLVWLEKFNVRYSPDYNAEITIKKDIIPFDIYKNRFVNGLKQLNTVLKNEGKIVFTFHNQDIKVWNAFLFAIRSAGFKIEKVIHQQNRRTGESNVANPYGTSATDFYIRCIKTEHISDRNKLDSFEQTTLNAAIRLIAQRNEPTPYQILFNGILADLSLNGFELEDFDTNIHSVLDKQVGNIFTITANNGQAGNLWFFQNPKEYIKRPDKPLKDRVEDSIINLLRQHTSITLDDVLGDIFVKYPNGLTPDIKSIPMILSKYAIKSGEKWKLRNEVAFNREVSEHNEVIAILSKIGNKLGYKTYVGKREQPEKISDGRTLREVADLHSLEELSKYNYDTEQIKRIEMIDLIFLNNSVMPECIFEVENSTNFTSGIQRASNLDQQITKFMIIPDNRENELNNISDRMFKDMFNQYNWKYIIYSDIKKIVKLRNITFTIILNFSKNIGNK